MKYVNRSTCQIDNLLTSQHTEFICELGGVYQVTQMGDISLRIYRISTLIQEETGCWKKLEILIPKRHNTQTFLFLNVLNVMLFSRSLSH